MVNREVVLHDNSPERTKSHNNVNSIEVYVEIFEWLKQVIITVSNKIARFIAAMYVTVYILILLISN